MAKATEKMRGRRLLWRLGDRPICSFGRLLLCALSVSVDSDQCYGDRVIVRSMEIRGLIMRLTSFFSQCGPVMAGKTYGRLALETILRCIVCFVVVAPLYINVVFTVLRYLEYDMPD